MKVKTLVKRFYWFCLVSRGREIENFLFIFKSLVVGGGGEVAVRRLDSFKSRLKHKRLFEAMGNISHFVPPSRRHSLTLAMANISEVWLMLSNRHR